jgi:hypothetical protein
VPSTRPEEETMSPPVVAARKPVKKEELLAHAGKGFIDRTGSFAINIAARLHGKFSDGLARVWKTVKGKVAKLSSKRPLLKCVHSMMDLLR